MRALLVEDDPAIAEFVARGLREAGFAVDHAADGDAGLAATAAHAYDVAIVDLMLPKRDGLSLIEEMRRRGQPTPVLILSARRSVDDRVRGLQTGGDDYLTKPFAFAELLARVQALVRRATRAPEATTLTVADLSLDLLSRRVTRGGQALDALPPGARVGTSSRRRAAQLRARWPHLICVDVRGNVETRLRKVEDGECAAVVLAAAGLARLGRLDVVSAFLEPDVMLPAPGQGAIALQARGDDAATLAALHPLAHAATEIAVRAERALLAVLGAGCTLPIGVLGRVDGAEVHLRAAVFQPDGRRAIRVERAGPAIDPEAVGRAAGQALLAEGAAAMLAEVSA